MSSPLQNPDDFKPASLRYPKARLVYLFFSSSPEERAKKFYSVSKTAKFLSLCRRTINQYIQEDKLAAIKVGKRKWQIYVPSIHRFLQQSQDEE